MKSSNSAAVPTVHTDTTTTPIAIPMPYRLPLQCPITIVDLFVKSIDVLSISNRTDGRGFDRYIMHLIDVRKYSAFQKPIESVRIYSTLVPNCGLEFTLLCCPPPSW